MVRIVENHAEISGTLLSLSHDDTRPGFIVLNIKVDGAASVGDWPNMFGFDVGHTIAVLARDGTAAAASKPGAVRLRVRKGGPATVFAE